MTSSNALICMTEDTEQGQLYSVCRVCTWSSLTQAQPRADNYAEIWIYWISESLRGKTASFGIMTVQSRDFIYNIYNFIYNIYYISDSREDSVARPPLLLIYSQIVQHFHASSGSVGKLEEATANSTFAFSVHDLRNSMFVFSRPSDPLSTGIITISRRARLELPVSGWSLQISRSRCEGEVPMRNCNSQGQTSSNVMLQQKQLRAASLNFREAHCDNSYMAMHRWNRQQIVIIRFPSIVSLQNVPIMPFMRIPFCRTDVHDRRHWSHQCNLQGFFYIQLW